jgi:hypothetical protein
MHRLFWKQILSVAALGLVFCSVSEAQSRKKDILGLPLGMPQAEATKQLAAIGCPNASPKQDEIKCETNKTDRLTLLMVKGMVNGLETSVVKRVEFIFQSNDGVQSVADKISTQFGNQPRGLEAQFHNCKALNRRYCEPGPIARWVLSDHDNGLYLNLIMNMPVGVPTTKKVEADEYWLQMWTMGVLSAEKEWQEFQLRNLS